MKSDDSGTWVFLYMLFSSRLLRGTGAKSNLLQIKATWQEGIEIKCGLTGRTHPPSPHSTREYTTFFIFINWIKKFGAAPLIPTPPPIVGVMTANAIFALGGWAATTRRDFWALIEFAEVQLVDISRVSQKDVRGGFSLLSLLCVPLSFSIIAHSGGGAGGIVVRCGLYFDCNIRLRCKWVFESAVSAGWSELVMSCLVHVLFASTGLCLFYI